MKCIIIIFVLQSIFIFGCKKNTSDNILHSELQPQIEITPVDSLIAHPTCGYVPSPSDSTASISLDIDSDGTDDFTVSYKTWYEFLSASSPCNANYNSRIDISGTSEDKTISI